jgi:4-amino-4-deoxy-L-arabinose transferase-like glycosyltransferase
VKALIPNKQVETKIESNAFFHNGFECQSLSIIRHNRASMAITNGNVKGLEGRGLAWRSASGWLNSRWPTLLAVTALLIAAGFKFVLLWLNRMPFNADEAVVALMARHIFQGERPIFFYGQAYMGSLDASLVAAGFYLFGEHVWVIRLVQALLYLGTLLTTAELGRRLFASRRVAALAVLLLAIPTVNVSLYTTASLGGYGEALLLGNLILLGTLQIKQAWYAGRRSRLWAAAGLWGFLVGMGLWAFGLTLIYSLPAALFLLFSLIPPAVRQRKTPRLWGVLLLLAAGFLVGASAWLFYAAQHGLRQLLLELSGSAIASAESGAFAVRFVSHLVNFLLLGTSVIFGLRPPWEVRWLGLPILPFVLFFWLAVCAWMVRKALHSHRAHGQLLLIGVVLTLMAGFLFTSFGVDPSGRYFVPLAVPLALFAADWILVVTRRRKSLAVALVLLVVGYQLWGNIQSATSATGLTTQFYAPTQIDHQYDSQLIQFLNPQGETTGDSNYWVCYPLAILSKEALIFTPRLPYHTDLKYTRRDDRYPPYDQIVDQASRAAYITTLNPALDDYLREHFQALQVSWREQRIGDYHVYYHFSRVIRPDEINLGETTLDTISK